MDSYRMMVLTLMMAVALGVGSAFWLTSNSNPAAQLNQRGQMQAFQGAPAVPPMDCAQFRGTLAERDCQALNQHYGLPPRESQIYNAATLVLMRQRAQTGSVAAPTPQAAYMLSQQMGLNKQDVSVVFQAIQDNYRRGLLVEQRAQILSELQSSPAR